ncbi:unnamed protein product [Amoebophrya sp. A25]|nr:unnamed protein product [Amoebophrya sp. A25]|eukprot:GSA25T00023383001.1
MLQRDQATARGKVVDDPAQMVLPNGNASSSRQAEAGTSKEAGPLLDKHFDQSQRIEPKKDARRFQKLATLLKKETLVGIKKLTQDPAATDIGYRLEPDGTSRGILEAGESGREVRRGTKCVANLVPETTMANSVNV